MNRNIFYDGGPVGPLMLFGPVVAAVASAVIGSVANKVLAPKPKAPKADPAILKAQAQQDALYAQQQAITNRQQNDTNKQTAQLDKQLAAQQAAALARRRNGGLSYTGPVAALKSTFGG